MEKDISGATATIDETDLNDELSIKCFSRNERAAVADDTLQILKVGWYVLHDGARVDLKDNVKFSMENSVLYTEDDFENSKEIILLTDEQTKPSVTYPIIEVRHCSTLQAARALSAEMDENRIGILNFASAKNPGGGFIRGSNAQEESLARSSSLYSVLSQSRFFADYYRYHRRGRTGIYSHRMIYSPRVTIFKDDNGVLLPCPYHVGMVTVAAPNATVVHDRELVRRTMTERIRRLLRAFKVNNHDCLVLGAFGCGVFGNDRSEVATIFRQHLESDEFKYSFKRIVFAVLDIDACEVFRRVLTETELASIQDKIDQLNVTYSGSQEHTCSNTRRQKSNRRTHKQANEVNDQAEEIYKRIYNEYYNRKDSD